MHISNERKQAASVTELEKNLVFLYPDDKPSMLENLEALK